MINHNIELIIIPRDNARTPLLEFEFNEGLINNGENYTDAGTVQ